MTCVMMKSERKAESGFVLCRGRWHKCRNCKAKPCLNLDALINQARGVKWAGMEQGAPVVVVIPSTVLIVANTVVYPDRVHHLISERLTHSSSVDYGKKRR